MHKNKCATFKVGRQLLLEAASGGWLNTLCFGLWLKNYTYNGCIKNPTGYRIQHILLDHASRQTCIEHKKKLVEHGLATLYEEKNVLVVKSFLDPGKGGKKAKNDSSFVKVKIPKKQLDFTNLKRCVKTLRVYTISTLQSNNEKARQQVKIQDTEKSGGCRQLLKNTRDYLDSLTAQGCTLSLTDEGMSLGYLAERLSVSVPTVISTNKYAEELGVYTTISGGFVEIGMEVMTDSGNTKFVVNPTMTEEELNIGNRDNAFIWNHKVCVPVANRYELSEFTRTKCLRCRTIEGIECGTWEKRQALPFRKFPRRRCHRSPHTP